jgi:XTP/dITP diphosphohydrolase
VAEFCHFWYTKGIELKLVLASKNKGKVREISEILGNSFEVSTLLDFEIDVDFDETGTTYEENAEIKALGATRELKKIDINLPVISDDSGLEVDFLGGRPGVYTARFAGPNATSSQNIDKLLLEMKGAAPNRRRAKFVCVVALVIYGKINFFRGECSGQILAERRGNNGFGYDPVFMSDGYENSMAELPPAEKNKIDHRAAALRKMLDFLNGSN